MDLRRLTLATLSIVFLFFSCKQDDDSVDYEERDEQEVYDENIAEIEEYLNTHFYNYEDFDAANPYSLANDEFEVVFDTIASDNGFGVDTSSKTSLMDMLGDELYIKTVTQNDIDYKLYILKIREGNNDNLHALDKAALNYRGILPDGEVFDSSIAPVSFNLTTVGSLGGVVTGFREALVEFKTSDGFTEATDGSIVYHNHGIGAVFIPSGLGYFSGAVGEIPTYSPIFFNFNLIDRSNTDYDSDGIPSYLEDLSASGDGLDDNTDGDSYVNFVDYDDDGDGVATRDEIVENSYNYPTNADAEAHVLGDDDVFISIFKESNDTYTLNTLTLTDSDDNGIADYLESDIAISN